MQSPNKRDITCAGIRFCIALLGCVALVAPFGVAKYYGHGLGLLVAWVAVIGNLIGWLCWGARKTMTLPARIIWLLGLAMLVLIGIFEFMHLSR